MLSYQHAYHAGCLADVHKHAAQLMVLQALVADSPRLTYVETHSGRGLYRLDSAEAAKTGEAKAGVLKLLRERRLPPQLAYSQTLRRVKSRYGEHAYPGSPLLAQMTLRPQDQLHCFELHPAEYGALSRHCKSRNTRLYKQDGYAGLARLQRGKTPKTVMVMIDPSFEVKAEYLQAAEAVQRLLRQWPQAVVLLWYPLLKAGHHTAMVAALEQAGLTGYWHQEIRFCAPESVRGMYGSGLVMANMPQAAQSELDTLPKLFAGLVMEPLAPIPVKPLTPKKHRPSTTGKPSRRVPKRR